MRIITTLLIAGLPFASALGSQHETNALVAVAGERAITVEQLRSEMQPYITRLQKTATSEADFNDRASKIEQEVLQSLVDRILIVKEFERIGGNIPKYYIENELDDQIKLNFNGDRATFVKYLEQEGKTLKEYRRDLEENVIVSIMSKKIKSNLAEVSPKKIEEYYQSHQKDFFDGDKIHLRQITLTAEDASAANEIISKLNIGQPFAEVAALYGIDEMKSRNGDWGWVYAEDMLPELSQAAFNLEVGSFSQPIHLNNHVFIIYVEDKVEAGVLPLVAVRQQIEDIIAQEKTEKARQKWLSELRSKTYVKYYLAGA